MLMPSPDSVLAELLAEDLELVFPLPPRLPAFALETVRPPPPTKKVAT